MSVPEGWAFARLDRVRFGDLDAMRHLNNVAFLGFFESARIAYLASILPEHRADDPDQPNGLIFAEAHIVYRSPGFYDEEICTLVRLLDVKRSSFRIAFRMEATGDGRLLADGWGTLVGYDFAAGRAARLTEAMTTVLTAELARTGGD